MAGTSPPADDFDSLIKKYSNWGRWGPDDQIGTLNLITPSAITKAAGEVRKGRSFSLSIPFSALGPQRGELNRFNPIHLMIRHGGDAALSPGDDQVHTSDDVVLMALQCATHWDALSHIFHRGLMYNGRPAKEVDGSGAHHNGIEAAADRVVGRGVLLDIPRLKKRPWLRADESVTTADLEEASDKEGLKVSEGDIVLVRTGQMAKVKERGNWDDFMSPAIPGLSLDCAEWISRKGVAAVAADNWGVEKFPSETAVPSPLHVLGIVYMGLTLGEDFDLEALAQDCAADEIYSFFFSAAPLPFTGAVGSPVNPMALK